MFALLLVTGAAGAGDPAASSPVLETDEQKVLYTLGQVVARRMAGFGLTEQELAFVQAGMADGLLGRPSRVDMQVYGPQLDESLRQRVAQQAERTKMAGEAFLAEAAGQPDARRLDSGIVYFEREPGSGPSPEPTDTVQIHYEGSFPDGRVFDSSDKTGEPSIFKLAEVVPCFGLGVQQLKVGGKAKLVCPPDQAYGERGFPPLVPPQATLIFEVELVGIVEAPLVPVPPAAQDPAAQPSGGGE